MSDGGAAAELLGHGGWQLDDVQARHRANPDTFLLPSEAELQSVEVGHAVRLIFRLADLADPIRNGMDPYSAEGTANLVVSHERMWLWVDRIEGDTLVGVLQNLPLATHSNLVPGARIRFQLRDVIEVDLEPRADMGDELAAMSEIGFTLLDEVAAVDVVNRDRPPAIAPSQLEVCEAAGVRPERPWDFARCLIDRTAADDVVPLYGARWKPRTDRGDCGWALWAQHRDMEVAAEQNGFDVVNVGEVYQRSRTMWRFLALPPGWAFTIGPDGQEDVYQDRALLSDD